MVREEKNKISDNIFNYISKELHDWMNSQIFEKTSMKDLGELYYKRVLSAVENANIHLINAVIRTIKPRNIECTTQEDYYIALCKILHFKKMPSEVWVDVKREYDEIFVQKYDIVMQKYQIEIKLTQNLIK